MITLQLVLIVSGLYILIYIITKLSVYLHMKYNEDLLYESINLCY